MHYNFFFAYPSSSSTPFLSRGPPPPPVLTGTPPPAAQSSPRLAASGARSAPHTSSPRSAAPHLRSLPHLRRQRRGQPRCPRLRRGLDHPSKPLFRQPLLLRRRQPPPHPQTLSSKACSAVSTAASRGVGGFVALRCLLGRLHRGQPRCRRLRGAGIGLRRRPGEARKTIPYH
jgi:hypothetical protein